MGLATSLDQVGGEEDYRECLAWAQKAADKGIGEGFWNLALLYEKGRGVEADTAKGVEYYRMGADAGHAGCQHSLGCYYMWGDFLPEDREKAFEFFRQSAVQGYGLALRDMGRCYQYGMGVPEAMGTAVEWYRKALQVMDDPELEALVSLYSGKDAGPAEPKDIRDLASGWEMTLFSCLAEVAPSYAPGPDDDIIDVLNARYRLDEVEMGETHLEGRADRCEDLKGGEELEWKLVPGYDGEDCFEFFWKGQSIGMLVNWNREAPATLVRRGLAELRVTVRSCIPRSALGKRKKKALVILDLFLTKTSTWKDLGLGLQYRDMWEERRQNPKSEDDLFLEQMKNMESLLLLHIHGVSPEYIPDEETDLIDLFNRAHETCEVRLEETNQGDRANRCEHLGPGTELTYKPLPGAEDHAAFECFYQGGSVGTLYGMFMDELTVLLQKGLAELQIFVRSCVPRSARGARAQKADVLLELRLVKTEAWKDLGLDLQTRDRLKAMEAAGLFKPQPKAELVRQKVMFWESALRASLEGETPGTVPEDAIDLFNLVYANKETRLEQTNLKERAEQCEFLRPGMELACRALSGEEKKVFFECFHQGKSVGTVIGGMMRDPADLVRQGLAEMKATVLTCIPLSARGKRATKADVTLGLHMEKTQEWMDLRIGLQYPWT